MSSNPTVSFSSKSLPPLLQNFTISNNDGDSCSDILLKKYVIDLNKIKLLKNNKNKNSTNEISSTLEFEIFSHHDDNNEMITTKRIQEDNESNMPTSTSPSTAIATPTVLPMKPRDHFVKFIKRNGKIIKLFECGICKKDFSHQYTLIRHLPMHTNERNFICKDCGKAFRQLSTLNQHRAIHSIDRPFTCEVCQKSFNRVSTLISHRKTHLNNKPYSCHICNKSFHQKGNLRNHIFIHTNARPYRCALCNRGFNQMSNLVCHAQKMHSNELTDLWCCTHCNLKFRKRSLLRAHELETHHYQLPSSTPNSPKLKISYSKKDSIVPQNAVLTSTKTNVFNFRENVQFQQLSPHFKMFNGNNSSEEFTSSIVISAIKTISMIKTKLNHETPFAVLHFIEGQPLLMRVLDVDSEKNLLRPVTSEDFRTLKKQANQLFRNTIDILMPIVAAIFQTLNSCGETVFQIKEPQNIYNFPKFKYTNKNPNDFTNVLINLNHYNSVEVLNNNPETIRTSMMNEQTIPSNINLQGQFYNAAGEITNYPWNNDELKKLAIVQDCNWWKQDEEEVTSTTSTQINERSTSNDGILQNDQYINATSVSPFIVKEEPFESLPSLNLDNIFSTEVTDSLNDDELNINLIRNFINENRKFFADIDDLVSELLQQ